MIMRLKIIVFFLSLLVSCSSGNWTYYGNKRTPKTFELADSFIAQQGIFSSFTENNDSNNFASYSKIADKIYGKSSSCKKPSDNENVLVLHKFSMSFYFIVEDQRLNYSFYFMGEESNIVYTFYNEEKYYKFVDKNSDYLEKVLQLHSSYRNEHSMLDTE